MRRRRGGRYRRDGSSALNNNWGGGRTNRRGSEGDREWNAETGGDEQISGSKLNKAREKLLLS